LIATIDNERREKHRQANGFQKQNQVRRLTGAPDFFAWTRVTIPPN
jgi:hypothetical protein